MRFYPGQEHFVGIACVYPTHIRQYGGGVLGRGPPALLIYPANSPGDPQHNGTAQGGAVPPKPKAHKVQRFLVLFADLPVALHFQAIGVHPFFDLDPHFMELLFVGAKNHHIVHISDVIRCAQLLLDVKIQRGKIEIRKALAQQHTDGQTVIKVYNTIQKGQHPLVLKLPAQRRL